MAQIWPLIWILFLLLQIFNGIWMEDAQLLATWPPWRDKIGNLTRLKFKNISQYVTFWPLHIGIWSLVNIFRYCPISANIGAYHLYQYHDLKPWNLTFFLYFFQQLSCSFSLVNIFLLFLFLHKLLSKFFHPFNTRAWFFHFFPLTILSLLQG